MHLAKCGTISSSSSISCTRLASNSKQGSTTNKHSHYSHTHSLLLPTYIHGIVLFIVCHAGRFFYRAPLKAGHKIKHVMLRNTPVIFFTAKVSRIETTKNANTAFWRLKNKLIYYLKSHELLGNTAFQQGVGPHTHHNGAQCMEHQFHEWPWEGRDSPQHVGKGPSLPSWQGASLRVRGRYLRVVRATGTVGTVHG